MGSAIAAPGVVREVAASDAQVVRDGAASLAETLRQLDDARIVLDRREAEVYDLRVELERVREWQPRAEVARAELEALRVERDGLRVRLERSGDEAAQLRDQLRGLEIELAARTSEVEKLSEGLVLVRAELEAAAWLRERNGQLERDQAATAEQLARIERAVEQLCAELRERDERLGEVTARRDELEREAQELRDELHEGERRLDELAARLRDAERAFDQARADGLEAHGLQRAEAERLRVESLVIQQHRDDLATRLEQGECEAERLRVAMEEQVGRLAEEAALREEAIRQADQLREQLLAMKLRRDEMEARLAEGSREIERLVAVHHGVTEELRAQAEESERARSDLRATERRLEELASRLEEREREAQSLRAGRDEAERALAEAIVRSKELEDEGERLRADHRELHRRLAEAIDPLDAARDGQVHALDEARGRWEAEHRDQAARWEQEQQAIRAEAERQLAEARAWAEAERRDLQGQHDQARQSLLDQLEAARHEAETAHQVRDVAERRAEALKREWDKMCSLLISQEQARSQSEQGLRDEVDRLRQALEQAQRDLGASASRVESLAQQVADAEDASRRRRPERGQEGGIRQPRFASLLDRLEATEVDAPRVAEATSSERTHLPPPAHGQFPPAKERPDQPAAARVTRDPVALLNHDLILSQIYEKRADQAKASAMRDVHEELASARSRIEELGRQLQKSQQANATLNGLLSGLGVRVK